jgi:hypothetical protein
MAIFGLYFTKNMLNQMGWPRKQGLFKKNIIDTTIFDSTVDQMVDWAAAIGAGRPELALKIIAYEFMDKDWESKDAPQIKEFIDSVKEDYRKQGADTGKKSPHEIVQPVRISKAFGPAIQAEELTDKRLQTIIEQVFLTGLFYGLGNHSLFETWYKNHLEDFNDKLPTMKKAGLNVDRLPTLSENYADSEQIIRNYEQEMEIHLPSIPAKLLTDAKALGVKI